MASKGSSNVVVVPKENGQSEREKRVTELLDDAEAREMMIQNLREGGHVARDPPANSGAAPFMFPPSSIGATGHNPWAMFPFPIATTPFPQFWTPPQSAPTGVGQQALPGSASSLGQPGSASSLGQGEEGEDEDAVRLLDAEEATEFANFNPTIPDDSIWEAGDVINSYLEKNFSREMKEDEKKKIMKDFPKPACKALLQSLMTK